MIEMKITTILADDISKPNLSEVYKRTIVIVPTKGRNTPILSIFIVFVGNAMGRIIIREAKKMGDFYSAHCIVFSIVITAVCPETNFHL